MLDNLFSKGKIGNCEMKNRLVVTAMVTNYCDNKGMATERYIRYHEEKAKGGWGLIITEDYAINAHCMGYERIAGLYDDSQIESHRQLTERVHQYGTKIFAQIYHGGRQSHSGVNGGVQPIAPSAIPCPWCRELPKEMTKADIHRIVEEFGACARRVKAAGFDGIELHAGHGYLLAEFMSTYANKRTDEYGGCLDNRVRIIKEILDEMRANVGDFPIIIRFSADEDMPGGRDIAETRVLAKLFEEWGFDGLHISGGVYGDFNKGIVSPMYVNHAWLVNCAEEVKKIVNIPVITVNRINDPRMADGLIEMKKADFVGMGRGSLADPFLPKKAQAGKLNDIRYCIGCLQGCTGALYVGGPVTCLVNPSVGLEYKTDYSKVANPKKIAIIGAGPAGLTTAITAARRGHQVTLFEAKDKTGGQFISAAYPPAKGEFTTFISWANKQLKDYGVNVLLNTKATVEMIKAGNYDEVVVTTGGTPVVPPIPGIDMPHVQLAEDVLVGHVAAGDNCIIAGGGEVGCETAAHLASIQKAATIVEMKPLLMEELDGVNKEFLSRILNKFHVSSYTSTKVLEIKENSVVVETPEGQKKLPCDSVIVAMGYQPNTALADELEAANIHVHKIAGAVKTSNALIANKEGFELGMKL
ncbi:FAD-dependent oxidoreductase [[Clostridium] spiroforme]|nr:FAD-dependent oxidoreductase [Thomasclavelia spiroformis]